MGLQESWVLHLSSQDTEAGDCSLLEKWRRSKGCIHINMIQNFV